VQKVASRSQASVVALGAFVRASEGQFAASIHVSNVVVWLYQVHFGRTNHKAVTVWIVDVAALEVHILEMGLPADPKDLYSLYRMVDWIGGLVSKQLYAVVEHVASCAPQFIGGTNNINAGNRAKTNLAKMEWWKHNFPMDWIGWLAGTRRDHNPKNQTVDPA